MFYVYVLEDQTTNSWYIGYTKNLKRRFIEHLNGNNITTRSKQKLKVIYYEAYQNKIDALGREKFLKGGSGRVYLKKQLKTYFRMPM